MDISTPTLVNWFRNKNDVSMPRNRMLKHTPENGSPFLNVTRKTSPTLTLRGLRL